MSWVLSKTGDGRLDRLLARIQQALNNNESLASDAKTTADSAQSDATQALSDASTAQSTADSAQSDATDAQTTADEAEAEIDEILGGGFNGLFFQSFDDPVDGDWNEHYSTTATITYPTNGRVGGKAISIAGDAAYFESPVNIPFDEDRTYRIRCRARLTSAPTDPADDGFYCGVRGIAADGSTGVHADGSSGINGHYVAASNDELNVADDWVNFVGYFSGHAASGNGNSNNDPTNPATLHDDVRYVRPMFIVNYQGGDGTMEVDFIAVDVLTEAAEIELQQVLGSLANKTGRENESGTGQTLPKNPELTGDLDDGETISFSGYDAPPHFNPREFGVAYEPDSNNWSDPATFDASLFQRMVLRLVNVTSGGAEVQAELQQPAGTITTRTEQFPGEASSASDTLSGDPPGESDVLMGPISQDSNNLNTSNLPADGNDFLVRWRVLLEQTSGPDAAITYTVTTRLYSVDGSNGSSTLRGTQEVYVSNSELPWENPFSANINAPDVDGDSGDRFRVEVEVNVSYLYDESYNLEIWGENVNDTPGLDGVEWDTVSSAPNTSPMTRPSQNIFTRFGLVDVG